MITIDNNKNITMTRGDTFARTLILKKNGQTYVPENGDVIRFAMAKVYKSKTGYELLIEKTIDNSTLLWKLDPEDTADLEYGKYVYDLQMTYADGSVETFADKKQFILTEEVE